MTARFLALLIVVVGVLDVISTNASIAAGGVETNVIILAIMNQLGDLWFVPKVAIHILVALFLLWLPSRQMVWKARVCVVVYGMIIASNFHIADWAIV
jgi:hypothetical protein